MRANHAGLCHHPGVPKGTMEDIREMDPAAIERLLRLGGNKLAVEMVDIFLDFAPQIIREAQVALPAGDFQTVSRTGHSLRSSARNLGANRLYAVAERLEQAALTPQPDQLPGLLAELEAAFLEVGTRLAELRKKLAP
jgi:HPt (histidine-containing phosphotransfer) domain-containing protein